MKPTICPSEPKYWNKKYRSSKGSDLYVKGDDGDRIKVMYVNHRERTSGHLEMTVAKWEQMIERGNVQWVEDGKYFLTNRL
jgi:hypothetical protein